jgi:hypothetical protein
MQPTFKISRRAAKQYPVESIIAMVQYHPGKMTLSMDPSLGGGGRLLVVDASELPAQLPGLLAVYEQLMEIPYHTEVSATRRAVSWWMQHASDLVALRETVSWRILSSESGQADVLQKYPVAVEKPYLITPHGSDSAVHDLRAVRAIGDRTSSSSGITRWLTVIHKWPENTEKNENDELVGAEVFETQFPGLIHAGRQFLGTSHETPLARGIVWWLANADELRARARILADVGMSSDEIGSHLWNALGASGDKHLVSLQLPHLEIR